MKPIDEIALGAFYHDIAYFQNRTGGGTGALFNLHVKEVAQNTKRPPVA